jgi:NitT/TauT family transport system substrate-binding protein
VVSAPGSYSDNVLRWTLKNDGLDPDKEFTLLSAGGGAAARAGLDTGKFDAVMSTTPDLIEDELNFPGKYRILYDWRKIPTSGQAVVAKKAWIDAHPEAAKGIARAVLKAEQLIQTDPAVVQQAVRKLFPERSDAYAKQLAAALPALISPDGRISDAGFLKMTEILRTIEPELKPSKLSDLDLTNALLDR